MKGLVDADILVFRSGFAAERNQWHLEVDKTRTGEVFTGVFEYKKDAVAKLNEVLPGIHSRVEGEDYAMWPERNLEPIENAFHNVNTAMAKIMEDCDLSEFDIHCYLSGDKNFRYDVAKTLPYKGNRDKTHRPTYEPEIRQFMRSKWETTITDGIEADDALGIAQCASDEETCIISIDKDLDMIPGLHYNFMQQVHYEITPEQAWKKFCVQVLMGDTTDNIPGLPKIGVKKAEKMLDGLPQEEWLEEVARQYMAKSERLDWFEYLQEQAALIWIRREDTDASVIPESLRDLGGDDYATVETSLFS